MKGTVTVFDVRRGWGFIQSDRRYFFHVKNSPDFHIELGAWVEFDVIPPFQLGQKDQAVNLRDGGAK